MTFVADEKTHFTGRYRGALSGSPVANSLPKLYFFALNLHEADLACNAKLRQRIAGIYQWLI